MTTKGVTARLEEIIYGARREIIICSPFLQINDDFHERLLDATEHNVRISFVYGKNELSQKEENRLLELNRAKKYYCHNLHAKCYANEKKMLITSMNFYDYSMQNNREMGIFLTRDNDRELFEDAMNEIQSIIRHSSEEKIENKTESQNNDDRGFCIRCGERIRLNAYKPYCRDCFKIWSQFENEDYVENVCHYCGEEADTSMEKPLCYPCYRNN